jgi:predicted  nucleic acid-binding Zn-ribbon protein
MADEKNDKKGNAKEKSITESRNVLYEENVELTSVLTNVLTLLCRMDTRLSGIEHNTSVNTTTLSQMNDKLTSLNARVITAETEIVGVKNRVAELETSSQGTSNLFDGVKPKTEKLESDLTVIQTANAESERDKQLIQDEIKKWKKQK